MKLRASCIKVCGGKQVPMPRNSESWLFSIKGVVYVMHIIAEQEARQLIVV